MDSLKINKLGLENFRIFKDYAEFEFKPLTILTGPNNSGKSSLLLALDLIKSFGQKNTSPNENNYDALATLELSRELKSKYGSFKEIIHNQSNSSLLTFGTDIPSILFTDILIPYYHIYLQEYLKVKISYQPDKKLNNPYERLRLKTLSIHYKDRILFKVEGKYRKYTEWEFDIVSLTEEGLDIWGDKEVEVTNYIFDFHIYNIPIWKKFLKSKLFKRKLFLLAQTKKCERLNKELNENNIYIIYDYDFEFLRKKTDFNPDSIEVDPGYYLKNENIPLELHPKCIKNDLYIEILTPKVKYKNLIEPDIKIKKINDFKLSNFCKIFFYPTLDTLLKFKIKRLDNVPTNKKEILKKELGEKKFNLLMKLAYLGLNDVELIDKILEETEDRFLSSLLKTIEYDLKIFYEKDINKGFSTKYPSINDYLKKLNEKKEQINFNYSDLIQLYFEILEHTWKKYNKLNEEDKKEIKELFNILFLDEKDINEKIYKKATDHFFLMLIIENIIFPAFDIWFAFHSNISHHFTPIRAEISRVFSFDKNNYAVEFYEQLNKLDKEEYQKRMDFINHWLKEFKIADSIEFKEIEGGGGFQIFIIKDGRKILLADNGYGLNQLIPVMLAMSTGENKIILVEEPEANLHPAFQSKLAELFVDAYHKFRTRFVLETHSEYLIRSLQVLIAKKTIRNSQVNIFYVNSEVNPEDPLEERRKKIYQMKIDENGLLLNGFGKGFFDEASNLSIMLLKTIGQN